MDTTQELISIEAASSMLGCHPMTIRRLMNRGLLGDVVRMGRKMVRIHRSGVEAYISKHTEAKS